ncbi:hypothetical protein PTTG_25263 [Puccinia triticina 1-1 BBBD Race 1]|uniref:GAF domain-containing protein n=2 Tax=Puccinia triticina TaxID=208348 RepID=A0A180H535_PUCT1|nr:uncharacterized protein PtA15_2A523 [Puccinia triticina]OAV99709.1 hypothetical protein PTTG_25263 [Puccinia triticina 1-1 BBBD Race 1]WAQ82206.1 hypothetical protein PtA15_2A523 [Puccinia triticina]WAR53062.1 hypothetical protein PtB15_2B491 [Puccinia triticina]
MASIISSPSGVLLPYPSLFNTAMRGQSTRLSKSRPSDYFWNKGTGTSIKSTRISGEGSEVSGDIWLDSCAPAVSDSEDESPRPAKKSTTKSKRNLRFTKFRRITFKAFIPRADSTGQRNNIVTTTEIIQREEKLDDFEKDSSTYAKGSKHTTILNSWRFRTNGTKTHVKKMVAVLKVRISASSPPEKHPQTWDEYHRYYANEEIDVFNPPLPPMEPESPGGPPSAFESRFYSAPNPPNEKVRQLALNRLGIYGGKPYDVSDDGLAKWKARVEAGDKLMADGQAPSSLDSPWERPISSCSDDQDVDLTEQSVIDSGMKSVPSPPETLEQHPVLRKIVNECRQVFSTSLCLLSVLDDNRQVFLAASGLNELGLGEMRDIPKEISFCAHTILSGRKGFAVLDSHKDWRFEKGPLVTNYGVRFYAGVPLMAPNLDKSQESEENTCPIGTLCILDFAPREKFSADDRKRLVYLSEYARREIEKWFARKMEQKMENLTASQQTWCHELKLVSRSPIRGDGPLDVSEVLTDNTSSQAVVPSSTQSIFRRFNSISTVSTISTLASSHKFLSAKSPMKLGLGLFDDMDVALSPKTRRVFDLATNLIGQTLDFSLVCLAAVVTTGGTNGSGRTMIISGYNIPSPVPVIDADLCLRALRAPQGGLLYQNPTAEESEEAGLQPQGAGAPTCASAMILSIGTEAYPNSGGFVLLGYTDDAKKVFGAEDVLFMNKFSQELSRYTSKIQL